MIVTNNKISSMFLRNILFSFLCFTFSFFISIKQLYALSHDWVGVPKSEYGEQLWDRKSIKRNKDGSVRVLSKFIPKLKVKSLRIFFIQWTSIVLKNPLEM